MKKIALAALVAFSFAAVSANAFMIEPFVGYETGDYEQGSASEDIDGVNLGLRLGGDTLGFMYGVEYQMGKLVVDSTIPVDADTTDLGIYVGYEFPILIRAYATYYIKHDADMEIGGDLEGSGGMKLGVSYTGLPFIVLNFEMMSRSFDEQGGASLATDIETDTMMVGVGLPLP